MMKGYVVERIVGKRLINGNIEYLIKWEGYTDSVNTWEKEEDTLCVALIRQFEKEQKLRHKQANFPTLPKMCQTTKGIFAGKEEIFGWDMDPNAEVDHILGVKRDDNGDLLLFVQWKGHDVCSFVRAAEARRKIPFEMQLNYYESKIKLAPPRLDIDV